MVATRRGFFGLLLGLLTMAGTRHAKAAPTTEKPDQPVQWEWRGGDEWDDVVLLQKRRIPRTYGGQIRRISSRTSSGVFTVNRNDADHRGRWQQSSYFKRGQLNRMPDA
jgi:hypothetical protein